MKTNEQSLCQHPFFRRMPADFFSYFSRCAATRRFRKGEQIFVLGHTADKFFLLTEGMVELETPYLPGEGMVAVTCLRAGEALGWSWFFPPYQWHFGARAIKDSAAVVVDGASLCQAAEENPRFGYWLSRRIGEVLFERLQATRLRLLAICGAATQPT